MENVFLVSFVLFEEEKWDWWIILRSDKDWAICTDGGRLAFEKVEKVK